MNEQMVQILYPERTSKPASLIISWARDYLATEYMRQNPHAETAAIDENSRVFSLEQAKEILSDSGTVTFKSTFVNDVQGLCPGCGRLMSKRECAEQAICNDCQR